MSTEKIVPIIINNDLLLNALTEEESLLSVLDSAWHSATEKLQNFAQSPDFIDKMELAFGQGVNVSSLQKTWTRNEIGLPPIEIVAAETLNGANGAFAAATGKIYLSQEMLQNQDEEAIVEVLLEEYGHLVDAQLNAIDAPGDEGAIFSALVLGKPLAEPLLKLLKQEDDFASVTLEGQIVQIEQANIDGNEQDNNLVGTDENDNISAGGGNDTIDAGLGYDNVDGGEGNDLLKVDYSSNSYSGSEPAAGINGSAYANGLGGFDGSFSAYRDSNSNYDQVSFYNIERFEITGTAANDNLQTGDGNDNVTIC